MSGVDENNWRFFVHVFVAYIVTAAVLYLFVGEFQKFVDLRQTFMTSKRPQFFSVLVTDVPEGHCSNQRIRQFFDNIFPNEVADAFMCSDLHKLESALDKLDVDQNNLHRALIMRERGDGTSKSLCCKKKDKVQVANTKLQETKRKVEQLLEESEEPTSTALVVFKTRRSASAALSGVISAQNVKHWRTQEAPAPNDVYLPNIGFSSQRVLFRRLMAILMVIGLSFFFMIPIGFIASLTTLEQLSESLPFLEPVIDYNAVIKGFLQGFLPSLALIIFLALLPKILLAVGLFSGHYSQSGAYRFVLAGYFTFLVYNVFLIMTVSGSLFTELESIIDSPSDIIDLLAASLPEQSIFFMTYFMTLACTGFSVRLLNPAAVILTWYKKKHALTEKDHVRATEGDPFLFGIEYAVMLNCFTIGLAYVIISPFVSVACLFLFAVAYIVYKNQIATFNKPIFDSGGLFFLDVFNRVIIGLVIMQLTLMGMFGLKQAPSQATLMIPLVALTIIYWNMTKKAFGRIATQPSFIKLQQREQESAIGNKKPLSPMLGLYQSQAEPLLEESKMGEYEGEDMIAFKFARDYRTVMGNAKLKAMAALDELKNDPQMQRI